MRFATRNTFPLQRLLGDRCRGKRVGHRRPDLEALEDRVVLSMLDLTTASSSGAINLAIYRQGFTAPAGSGNIQSFVRMSQSGTEYGYNTDARPYVDPVLLNGVGTTATFNRSLPLDDVPLVSIGDQVYLDFVLDINQLNSSPFVSLDQVQIYLENSGSMQGTAANPFPAGFGTPIYDMNPGGGSSNWVALNADLSSGSGGADMYLYIPLSSLPDSAFIGANRALPLRGDQYIYLYSHLGGQGTSGPGNKATGGVGPVDYTTKNGFEEWAVPTLGATASSTSTTVY